MSQQQVQHTRAIPLLDQIYQRGYWRVVIHPGRFAQERIAVPWLYPLLVECSVLLRCWDFPQTALAEPRTQIDWIECDSDYGLYLEYWRFYQSGQFVDVHGMTEDWRDRSRFFPPYP